LKSPVAGAVPPSSGGRLAGIEGLRAIAATSIVVYHVWLFSAPSGQVVTPGRWMWFFPDLALGVTLFFTLSGFLLYRPFVAALLRAEPRPSFGSYLRNRVLRIAPAYWVIFLFSVLILESVLVRGPDGRLVNGALHNPVQIGSNLLLVQEYKPSTVATGIGPAWSLAVEIVFYLSLPLLTILAWSLARNRTSRRGRMLAAFGPPLLLLALGLCGKFAAAELVTAKNGDGWSADWHSVLERSFLCHADLFAFGMIVAILRVNAEDRLFVLTARTRKGVAAVALLLFAGTVQLGPWERLGHSPANTLVALSLALLLLLVVIPATRATPPVLVRVLEARLLVWIGVLSYSLFLLHEPLIRWLNDRGLTLDGGRGLIVNIVIALGVSFALSWVSYRLVERPALLLKSRTRPRAEDASPAVSVQQPAPLV
jgi:peptidoglycan/LPS O-acetylase OafA/YrhL